MEDVKGAVQAPAKAKRGAPFWAGWVLTGIPILLMVSSGIAKIAHAPPVVENWQQKFQYPLGTLTPIGLVEGCCAVLGAILTSCYFGGATATHVRIQDPAAVATVLIGIFAWLGLWLRDERLRPLAPLRR
jgi:hypothetical protein